MGTVISSAPRRVSSVLGMSRIGDGGDGPPANWSAVAHASDVGDATDDTPLGRGAPGKGPGPVRARPPSASPSERPLSGACTHNPEDTRKLLRTDIRFKFKNLELRKRAK